MGYFEICNIFVRNFKKMDKIIGMGNALVDVIVTLQDNKILDKLNFHLGSMQLIDEDKLLKIQSYFKQMQTYKVTGGSAGNTIRALAKLNIPTGYIGQIGNDEYGEFFQDSLQKNGTETKLTIFNDKQSGIASTFVSPNSERTFGTYLGAAALLSPDCVQSEMFNGYQYLYIEGYLVQNHSLITHAMQLAKNKGLKICMDMSSYNIVAQDLDFFKYLMTDYVDIVFANEQEAKAYSKGSIEDVLEVLGSTCEIAVVKVGSEGSYINRNGKITQVKAFSVNDVIDTNGAGDYYAAGFLYGLINNCSMAQCGRIGSLLSKEVIRVIGTHLADEQWTEIKLNIKQILS